jgi:SAM-dependent methyltransferase
MFTTRFLSVIRSAEIDILSRLLPPGAHMLDIGAGTGQQSRMFSERGFTVEAIDVEASNYAEEREFPIQNYDGTSIPFPDRHFDVVYTSNLLEHLQDLASMHDEIARVLKPDGFALHAMPTHSWRFWTSVSSIPDSFLYAMNETSWAGIRRRLVFPYIQERHGERGNILTEFFYFHPAWWRRNFRQNGYVILEDRPIGLFYTGNCVLSEIVPINTRKRLSSILGSAAHIYMVRPAATR